MRRLKRSGKVIVSSLAIILVMTFSFTGVAQAELVAAGGGGDFHPEEGWQYEINAGYNSITKNDLAVFSNEKEHYKMSSSEWAICPNNTSYLISGLYWSGNELTGDNYNKSVSYAGSLPYDMSLHALFWGMNGNANDIRINWAEYILRDLTVVDSDTTIYIPGWVKYTTPNGDFTNETDIILVGRKKNGEWDTLMETHRWNTGGDSEDLTLRCSDFIKDDYVYYNLWTTMGAEAAVEKTMIGHFIVPDGGIDAFKKMCSVIALTPKTVDVGPEGTMYRMYNENSGEHFYTADSGEAQGLTNIGWTYEGHAWKAPTSSSTPVYRVYNSNSGEHHYTSSAGERDSLVSIGWKDEGIGFFSGDSQGVPMYRLYNPNAKGEQEAGAHHYTSNAGERDGLIAIGWRDEGISWYGLQ